MKKRLERLRWWEAALMAVFAVLLLCLALGGREQRTLAEQVVRLHVLANSDDPADQALKLEVRDAILAEAEPLLAETLSQAQAETALRGSLDDLARAGQEIVEQAGYDYPVRVELTTSYFPTREYTDFSLPAGYYRALRVEIGAAEGHNWWCVVYPPLCSVGVTEAEPASLGLTQDQLSLITQEDSEYVLRFQCAEWWGELTRWLTGQ
ncbi:MAG: stage II sporulation protein R [Candidatus Onthomonas sp.]